MNPASRSDGRLERILVAAAPGSPMASVTEIRAVAGVGLEGDRYAAGLGTFSPAPHKPDFEVTLIEAEAVEAYAREAGRPFAVEETRRNLVTRGIGLNALVGREFRIGPVRLRGIRLCEPCSHLARITHAEVLRGLVHRGGLRARIVRGGTLRVGDPVVPGPAA